MSRRRSLLFASLARMTGAGMPVLKAGKLLENRMRDAGSRRAIQALEAGVARGESIAGALRPALTGLEYRMVGAAESGGRLSAGFSHLERYYALLAEARSSMLRAALYPLALLHVAALTSGVSAHLSGKPVLPAVAAALLMVWAVLLLLYFTARGLLRLAGTSEAVDGFIRAVPLLSGFWKNLALSRWSAVLHFHLISSQRMSAALESAAGACGSARLAAASSRLAAAAAEGNSVAEAMVAEPVFPEFFATGFLTAEATGTLDTETQQQMESRMTAATASLSLLAEWLPKILYIAALAYGAWQVFQMAGAIGGQYQRAIEGKF